MLAHSPRIVTNGMVLCLDAANPKNFNLTEVEVLVVAGGGGGGGGHGGGGGGAGGLIYNRNFAVTPGSALTVTVGGGGNGSNAGTPGSDGSNSVFGALTATGGGGGGGENSPQSGRTGGSGGGGSGFATASSGGAATSGQGFGGGGGGTPDTLGGSTYGHGGGGGGAAGAGTDGSEAVQPNGNVGTAGVGGSGLGINVSGTFTYYAGGGGGGYWGSNLNGGAGGLGGGGRGGDGGSQGQNGTTNTGGGGGGSPGAPVSGSRTGGNGGSGIVIVRYPGPQKAIGGTVTTVGGHTIHTFTSSTTFTPLVATNNSAILGLSDLSGRGNFGTTVNSPTYSNANGGSIVFDGTDDIVINGVGNDYPYPYHTIDVWVKSPSLSPTMNGGGGLIAFDYGRILMINSVGGIYYVMHDGNGYLFISNINENLIFNNTWHNVVALRGEFTYQVYVDGILKDSGSNGGNSGWNGLNVWSAMSSRIGDNPNDNRYKLLGNIASVKVYNRALTAAEISQNFNALRGRYGI